jgi:transcriptional regulator with XRE-family HTH domain
MKPSDLARRAGVDNSVISNILNERRNVGPEVARAIAAALDLPEEAVFRQAGLLSPEEVHEETPTFLEMTWVFWHSTPEEREEMVRVARALYESNKARKEAERRRNKRDDPRPGET